MLAIGLGLLARDLEFFCNRHQIDQGCGLHLSHHIPAVDLHRDLADADFAGNLLVETPSHHESHHFALALRQGIEAGTEHGDRLFVLAPGAVPLKAQLENLWAERLPRRCLRRLESKVSKRLDVHMYSYPKRCSLIEAHSASGVLQATLSGLLAQYLEQGVDLAPIALDPRGEFLALCHRHADALHDDIG